jgi:predicted kinase
LKRIVAPDTDVSSTILSHVADSSTDLVVMGAAGVPFRGLFLVAALKSRIDRVSARELDASDADAVIARQQETFDLGRMDWTQVDASDSLVNTVERVRAAIDLRQMDSPRIR